VILWIMDWLIGSRRFLVESSVVIHVFVVKMVANGDNNLFS